jgi:hypothetical protein
LRGKRDGNLAQRHPAIAILDSLGEKDHVRVALDVLTGFNAASPWPSEAAESCGPPALGSGAW